MVVTRPVQQAHKLCALIEECGGTPLRYPAVSIVAPVDPERATRMLRQVERFDYVVFVSPTAVQEGLALLGRGWPEAVVAAAVGPGTRTELERHGIPAVISPAQGADSGALLSVSELADVRGRRVLIVRGEGGRELLAETLRSRGAQVEYAECYRRMQAGTDFAPLAALWERGEVHAWTAFSAAALENVLSALPGRVRPRALGTPLFASHSRIAQRAAALGATHVREAGPGDDDMLHGLVAHFTSPASGQPP